ncbi:hypothetical protein VTN02DRAFT_2449 [Thermoascus thermophilus]
MALPPLSMDQLSQVLSSAPTYAALYDTLFQYESQACLLFTDTQLKGDPELLSAFYSSFLISHLLTDQINEARMLTHRMPPTLVKDDPTLQNGLALLRAVWQNNHAQVYKILRELPWPDVLKGIVQSYEAYFQEKTFKDVSRAYEAIRPATAAAYLGLGPVSAEEPDPAVLNAFTARGWGWDEEAKLLRPKVVATPPDPAGPKSNGMSQIVGLIGNYGG